MFNLCKMLIKNDLSAGGSRCSGVPVACAACGVRN